MYSLAYFNWVQKNESTLITNDLGKFLFISNNEFSSLLNGSLQEDTDLFHKLLDAGFIFKDEEQYISTYAEGMACMKQCLLIGTQLLILVLTDACNQRCVYCQA